MIGFLNSWRDVRKKGKSGITWELYNGLRGIFIMSTIVFVGLKLESLESLYSWNQKYYAVLSFLY